MVLYHGDCLYELRKIADESVDLVYLDPPFFTQKIQKLKTRDNTKEYLFSDTWNSIDAYKQFLQVRISECARVLKETGSIFLHCDRSASHHLRLILDDVFGASHFRSEIIWYYRRWSSAKRGLLNSHQTIYFYSKTPRYKFNEIFTDYSPITNIEQILQDRERDDNGKSVYKKDGKGNVISGKFKKGVPLTDVWDIPYLNPKAAERVGYPTQKPILLLERIIQLVTDEGDTVLDPFCGSGTTLVAAKLLNRKSVGIDISEEALDLTRKRLENSIKTESRALETKIRNEHNRDGRITAILQALDARVVPNNKGIDGFLKRDYNGKSVAVRVQREHESIQEAKALFLKACRNKGFGKKILIRTSTFEDNHLFENDVTDNDLLVIDSCKFSIDSILDKEEEIEIRFSEKEKPHA
ncbi:site-specific DNA-methyltransferase [Candidatus Poribacteria bacterium]|nr:site-specific DNA-methyltransferase [Candidatus Poribacteria bacterium]